MRPLRIFILPVLLGLSACAKFEEKSTPPPPEKILTLFKNLGCGDLESRMWDAHVSELRVHSEIPAYLELEERLLPELDSELRYASVAASTKENLLNQYKKLLAFLSVKVPQSTGAQELSDLISDWTALEIGDRSTKTFAQLRQDYFVIWNEMKSQISDLNLPCHLESIDRQMGPNLSQQRVLNAGVPLSVWGARKAMATAYQSCESLSLPSMGATTDSVQGISIVGRHSDGIGYIHQISNLSLVQKTHYYVKNYSTSSRCLDVRSKPLIYDYGGKPFYPADDELLNFFVDAGSGGKSLGVDCSGYLYTALAAGGLKIDPSKAIKARYVSSIPARMYMEPSQNGMNCFAKPSFKTTQSLQKGDVIAISGHIVMVEKLGADPLGIQRALSNNRCDDITSDQFDFVAIHSAPIKGDIGINKSEAKDFIKFSVTMRSGLEKLARNICNAVRSGTTALQTAKDISVVRHLGTNNCIENPLPLYAESCISACSELTSP